MVTSAKYAWKLSECKQGLIHLLIDCVILDPASVELHIWNEQNWIFKDGKEIMSITNVLHIVGFRGGGGVLRFELDRCVPLEPQNPYPSLRAILAKKGSFQGFSFKNRPIFQKFRDLGLALSQKSWPMFKDFLGKKRDPCLRISCKKATH